MGVGKSSVARRIAQKLSWNSLDLDELIMSRQGKTIAGIFESEGEEVFRRMETEALREALKRERVVIATGGGILLREVNRELLRNEVVVNLGASFQELERRVKNSRTERPLAKGPVEEFRKRFEERKPLYDAIERQVDTEGKQPGEIAEEIITRFLGVEMEKPG
jgi:shikimate kinase